MLKGKNYRFDDQRKNLQLGSSMQRSQKWTLVLHFKSLIFQLLNALSAADCHVTELSCFQVCYEHYDLMNISLHFKGLKLSENVPSLMEPTASDCRLKPFMKYRSQAISLSPLILVRKSMVSGSTAMKNSVYLL